MLIEIILEQVFRNQQKKTDFDELTSKNGTWSMITNKNS